MRGLLELSPVYGTEAAIDAYRHELDQAIPETLGYPLGSGPALTAEQLKATIAALGKVRADAAAPGLPAEVGQTLESRFARAARIAAFAASLVGADGNLAVVKIQLIRDRDQAATIERAIGAAAGGMPRQALARIFPSMRVAGRDFRPRGLPENIEIDKFSLVAPLSRMEFFTTPDPKPVADVSVDPGADWGALHLIQSGSVRRAEGKEWDAVIHVTDRGIDLVLAVSLVFDQPLPALDRWPAPPAK